MGRGREKDCNPESVSMASGLRKALRMILIENGLSSMKTKQGRMYVIVQRPRISRPHAKHQMVLHCANHVFPPNLLNGNRSR